MHADHRMLLDRKLKCGGEDQTHPQAAGKVCVCACVRVCVCGCGCGCVCGKAKLAPRGERMISWQPIADEVSKVGKGRTNVQCQVLETVPWLWRLCRLPRSCLFPVPSCHLCPKTAYLRLPPLPSACRHLRRLPVACCAAGKVEAPHRTRGASGEAAQALQAACLVV